MFKVHDDDTVSEYPPKPKSTLNQIGAKLFVHILDETWGISAYSVDLQAAFCLVSKNNKTRPCAIGSTAFPLRLVGSAAVGWAGHAGSEGKVLSVAYPSAFDKINSRAYVLGTLIY